MYKRILFLTIIALLIGCGSEKVVNDPPETQPGLFDTLPDLSITPMENADAEIAALALSRKLVAPVDLYERIRGDLENIRNLYGDSIIILKNAFRGAWDPGIISARFDSSALFDSSSQSFMLLDSLNRMFRLDSIKKSFFIVGYDMYFSGRFNPVRMVELYGKVKGFRFMTTLPMFFFDRDEFFVYPSGKEFKYFFVHGWGDCPSGCYNIQIYYFSADDSLKLIDDHVFGEESTSPDPVWVDTFLMARDTISYNILWYPDSVIYLPRPNDSASGSYPLNRRPRPISGQY